jgi:hypothetical protein
MSRRVFAVVFGVDWPVSGAVPQVGDQYPADHCASVAPNPVAHGRCSDVVCCGQWGDVDLVL